MQWNTIIPVLYQLIMLFASVACNAYGELFSSMAHLQTALFAEQDIARELRLYVVKEQDRLKKLSKIADEFEEHSQVALKNPDNYLGNPVNAYLFVKHFTLDWDKDIDVVLKNHTAEELVTRIDELKEYLPTYEDLTGSVNALLRLQDTYKLDTAELALGNVGGVKTQELSAWDCFELGRLAYNEEDYYHTIMWMEEALSLNKIAAANEEEDIIDAEVLDYLAFSMYKDWVQNYAAECFEIGRQAYAAKDFYHTITWMQEAYDKAENEVNKTLAPIIALDYLTFSMYKQGNIRRALSLTNEMLSLEPEHKRAIANKAYYERMIQQDEQNTEKRGDDGEITNKRQLDSYRTGEEFTAYEALCRGETIMENRYAHQLKCRYRTNGHPLLLIRPMKEEQIYKKPYIVIFHDAITEQEIKIIKELATPKLGRATVHNPQTGKLETAHYRVSKSCWLSDRDSNRIGHINDRISAATGLTMDTAEELQIANYGIGGQYEPHFDFARDREPNAFEQQVGNRIATFMFYKHEPNAFQGLGTGNRIATFMFYISDVQAGGATVFPYLGLKVFPEKGKAIFWYNLFKNGEGIYDTRHAACPVLVGSKWVSNKWIHERGQEFLRRCGLTDQE